MSTNEAALTQDERHDKYREWRDAAKLSVVMIGRDEGFHLANNLPHILGEVYELIYMDTGSTDASRDWMAGMGAKVYDTPWRMDFSAARNAALEKATGRWILSLDCDEFIPRQEMRNLNRLLSKADWTCQAFKVEMEMSNDNIPIEGELNQQLRCFPNHKGLKWQHLVHEQIAPALMEKGIHPEPAGVRIIHKGYNSMRDPNTGQPDNSRVKAKCQRNRECLGIEIERSEAAVAEGKKPERMLNIPYYHMAKCAAVVGVFEEAEEYIRKCVETALPEGHPDYQIIAGYKFWGDIYSIQGKNDEALVVWETAAKRWPADVTFPTAIGVKLAEMGRLDDAYSALRGAADMDVIVGPVASPAARGRYQVYELLAKICAKKAEVAGGDEALMTEAAEWREKARSMIGVRSKLTEVPSADAGPASQEGESDAVSSEQTQVVSQ